MEDMKTISNRKTVDDVVTMIKENKLKLTTIITKIDEKLDNKEFWWWLLTQRIGFNKFIDYIQECGDILINAYPCDLCGEHIDFSCELKTEKQLKIAILGYIKNKIILGGTI